MKKVIFIFLDGVGIGKEDKETNPFFKHGFNTFTKIFESIPSIKNNSFSKHDKYVFPIDTIMGVNELPQSGTGQTSIFCGFNAQKYLGKHFGPYPHSSLHPLIKKENIFTELKNNGKKPFFANAYPQIYFEHLNRSNARVSVPTLCSLYSDTNLNKYENLKVGKALSPEIDNHRWVEKLKYDLPIITPEKAAFNLLNMVSDYDFVLYEYFFTDHLGHGRLSEDFIKLYETLDRFLFTILSNYEKDCSIFITTDHGNFEDLSVKSHTLNPGLAISAGYKADSAYKYLKDISQIKGFILDEIFI